MNNSGLEAADDLDQLVAAMRAAADQRVGAEMSAYMKNKFPFLGLPKPRRASISKPFLAGSRGADPATAVAGLDALLRLDEREFHYVGIDLVTLAIVGFARAEIDQLALRIDVKPWWDSVDAIRKPIGLWLRTHPEQLAGVVDRLLAGSMWQRRVAITCQLQWKQATNTAVLDQAIAANTGDAEFFIQKAIGWALRDYSRTDPAWVTAAIKRHGLTGLAAREAAKRLKPPNTWGRPGRTSPCKLAGGFAIPGRNPQFRRLICGVPGTGWRVKRNYQIIGCRG